MSGKGSSPFTAVDGGVRVTLRLQPGARGNGFERLAERPDGGRTLRARVGAPPEGGRANAALVKLLAKAWRVPKGSIEIQAGRSERNKTLLVAGDPAELLPRLEAWLDRIGASGRR